MNNDSTSNRPAGDIISTATAGTLYGLFRERVRRSPAAEAYRYYDPGKQAWRSNTWSEMSAQVARWQATLAAEPLSPGDRVAIMLHNCREWVLFDQAAFGLGLVVVPIFYDDRGENAAYILQDAGARLLLIGGLHQWSKLAGVSDQLGQVERIISLSDLHGYTSDRRLRLARDWLPVSTPECVTAEDLDPEALATIVYTSGTTGPPKGVMLSHRNILTNAENSLRTTRLNADYDLFLSFLPLSHAFERTVGYYIPMMTGCPVAYARSIPQLAEDIRTLRPTVLISVPRVFERIYLRIQDQLAARPLARGLFKIAVAVGWRRFLYQQRRRRRGSELLLYPVMHWLVGRKVLQLLGGRLRLVITGSAAIPHQVAETFIGLGLTLLQGYGLTEYSPVVSVNRIERNDPASVGPTILHTEVAIGDQDELLVRGPSVMLGYWNQPAATAEKIDREGWLHTGDKARIRNGFIYIIGRIKAIIVLANGEKISPEDMEATIAMDPVFEQVLVLGEHRPYLSALVVLNNERWQQVFLKNEYNAGDNVFDPHDPDNQQLLLDRIDNALKGFPGYACIRRVAVCDERWTIENGLMTPHGKPKRQSILDHYRDQISDLYKQENTGRVDLSPGETIAT